MWCPPVAPSAVRSPREPTGPGALSDGEVDAVIEGFRISAVNLSQAGFQVVEPHAHVATCWRSSFHADAPAPDVRAAPLGDASSSKASPSRAAVPWKAAAQPARVHLTGPITSVPSSAAISTSLESPVYSSSGFGMRMPREFPIGTMRVFMATTSPWSHYS